MRAHPDGANLMQNIYFGVLGALPLMLLVYGLVQVFKDPRFRVGQGRQRRPPTTVIVALLLGLYGLAMLGYAAWIR
jgi:hypothetical protein